MTMVNIGVIGYGYWGPNLVRNFAEIPESQVIAVSDLSSERLAKVQARYPQIKTTTDCEDLFKDPKIDAIVIATPVASHFQLALSALQAGKHVFVEKPLTSTSEQALRLIEVANRRNLTLMVDHTFVYTGAIHKIRELVVKGQIGTPYYYDSVRVNLGLFRHDVNVLWDLATHDLSIMDYVLSSYPSAVSATSISHVYGQPENMAYMTLFFENNLMAHLHVNWLAPVKVRRTLIGGSKKMIVYDDLEPSEKVKIYDKGISLANESDSINQMLVGYRTGDIWIPQLSMTEALRTEALHFVDCIQNQKRPITDGYAGLRIIQILEAATRSVKERGEPVDLNVTSFAA